jgi:hypothetical protein
VARVIECIVDVNSFNCSGHGDGAKSTRTSRLRDTISDNAWASNVQRRVENVRSTHVVNLSIASRMGWLSSSPRLQP